MSIEFLPHSHTPSATSEEYKSPLNSRLTKIKRQGSNKIGRQPRTGGMTMIDFEITQAVDGTTFSMDEQPTDIMSTWSMSILVQIKHS